MKTIDFDIDEYVAAFPWCEGWRYATDMIRNWCWQYQGLMQFHRRVQAHHVAHIIGGPGRKHYLANILHLNSALHAWCDSHGRAGRVLMMHAKWLKNEHDFALWGRLMTECNHVAGWFTDDKTVIQCKQWGIDNLRDRLALAAEIGF